MNDQRMFSLLFTATNCSKAVLPSSYLFSFFLCFWLIVTMTSTMTQRMICILQLIARYLTNVAFMCFLMHVISSEHKKMNKMSYFFISITRVFVR